MSYPEMAAIAMPGCTVDCRPALRWAGCGGDTARGPPVGWEGPTESPGAALASGQTSAAVVGGAVAGVAAAGDSTAAPAAASTTVNSKRSGALASDGVGVDVHETRSPSSEPAPPGRLADVQHPFSPLGPGAHPPPSSPPHTGMRDLSLAGPRGTLGDHTASAGSSFHAEEHDEQAAGAARAPPPTDGTALLSSPGGAPAGAKGRTSDNPSAGRAGTKPSQGAVAASAPGIRAPAALLMMSARTAIGPRAHGKLNVVSALSTFGIVATAVGVGATYVDFVTSVAAAALPGVTPIIAAAAVRMNWAQRLGSDVHLMACV